MYNDYRNDDPFFDAMDQEGRAFATPVRFFLFLSMDAQVSLLMMLLSLIPPSNFACVLILLLSLSLFRVCVRSMLLIDITMPFPFCFNVI